MLGFTALDQGGTFIVQHLMRHGPRFLRRSLLVCQRPPGGRRGALRKRSPRAFRTDTTEQAVGPHLLRGPAPLGGDALRRGGQPLERGPRSLRLGRIRGPPGGRGTGDSAGDEQMAGTLIV